VTAIETVGLTKRFRHVVAVDGVSLTVPTGARFGLLGPNGSGKTTLVRMLLGLVHPTQGRVTLLGRPMPRDAARVLPRVGALVEGPAAWPHLSGRTNLRMLDAAGRSGREDRADRVEEALVRVGLGGIDGRPVRAYSLGMRQRLGIAAALLRKPELLLLDEPTNGLDPRGIGEMRELLREFAAEGTTVVLSSHLLSEVEALCTQVGLMSEGRLVLTEDLDALRAPTGLVQVRTPDPAAAVGVLDGRVVHRDGDLVMVRADNPADLNARLVAAGVAVLELTALRRTLEQVVLELTGPSADRVERPSGAGPGAPSDRAAGRRARGRGGPDRADRAAGRRARGRGGPDGADRAAGHRAPRPGGPDRAGGSGG
jgi:ABC-2 type transport system ATP-binding protein